MKLVKVEEAKDGQKVAKDVTDLKGVLLFKAGTTLTDQVLQRIQARNISHIFIDVDGEGDGTPGSGLFKTPQAVDKEIDALFGDVSSNELMSALCEAAKKYHKSHIR